MSVKIYDGMLIERDLSLDDLRALAKKARPKLSMLVERAQLTKWAQVAADAYDMALMGIGVERGPDEREDRSALGRAFDHIEKERSEDKKGRRAHLPMGFESCFMAIGAGKTLLLSYGDGALKEAFAKMVKAKPYGYWDNTDEPEGMGRQEWSQRKRDWQKAMGRGFDLAPSEAGVTVKLVAEKYATWWNPEFKEIKARLEEPDFTKKARAERMAEALCRDIYMKGSATYQKYQEDSKTAHSLSGLMQAMREWSEASKKEAKPMLDLAVHVLESNLPKLDEDALRMPVAEVATKGAALKAMVHDRLALMALQSEPTRSAPKQGL